jgi:hypothetical protein
LDRFAEALLRQADVARLTSEANGPILGTATPRWVGRIGGGGELWVGVEVVKRVRHDAACQLVVLEELERSAWPKWCPNPLPLSRQFSRKRALRNAVHRLNRGQRPLRVRFHADDGGVRWEIVT